MGIFDQVASSSKSVYLPQGSAVYFGTNKLSEHNRAPISFGNIRIEKRERMSNGSMRKLHTADKKTIDLSWSSIPSYSTMTLDNGYGALDLRNFYETTGTGEVTVNIYYSSTRTESITMVFTGFNCTLSKRNVKAKTSDSAQELWDISCSLEQV